jgi:hypothetical protein
MCRVGHNHIYIYGVYTEILARNSPNLRSYTVEIYGSGQPYICDVNKGFGAGVLKGVKKLDVDTNFTFLGACSQGSRGYESSPLFAV